MSARQIQVVGLDGIGEVDSTTDLTALIAPCCENSSGPTAVWAFTLVTSLLSPARSSARPRVA